MAVKNPSLRKVNRAKKNTEVQKITQGLDWKSVATGIVELEVRREVPSESLEFMVQTAVSMDRGDQPK